MAQRLLRHAAVTTLAERPDRAQRPARGDPQARAVEHEALDSPRRLACGAVQPGAGRRAAHLGLGHLELAGLEDFLVDAVTLAEIDPGDALFGCGLREGKAQHVA